MEFPVDPIDEIERTMSFEELVFNVFSKKVEKLGFRSRASVTRGSGGDGFGDGGIIALNPDIAMIDRDTVSKFVEIVRFRVHFNYSRKGVAASFSTMMTDMVIDLKNLPYVLSVSIDTEFSERVGMPVTWVYTQDFSVRIRRGVSWRDVYFDSIVGH